MYPVPDNRAAFLNLSQDIGRQDVKGPLACAFAASGAGKGRVESLTHLAALSADPP